MYPWWEKCRFFVLVVVAPRASINPTYQTANIGANVQFRCSAQGFPRPRTKWHLASDEPLPENARVENGNLKLSNVQPSNERDYYCTATNRGGTVTRKAMLYIRGWWIMSHSNSESLIRRYLVKKMLKILFRKIHRKTTTMRFLFSLRCRPEASLKKYNIAGNSCEFFDILQNSYCVEYPWTVVLAVWLIICWKMLNAAYFCKTFNLQCLTVFWIHLCPVSSTLPC